MIRILPIFSFILLILFSCKEKSEKDIVLNFYKHGHFNGTILIVKNGKVICDTVLGYKSFEEKSLLTKDTPFCIASITKPFTAVGIMLLQQQHLLSYDDKASRYVPSLPVYAQNITIRQLLTHTSGLPDYENVLIMGSHKITNKDVLDFLKKQSDLRFLSGSKFEYSNSGYVVLGQIIEVLSGESYSKFMQNSIFTPLKMHHSFVYDSETIPSSNIAKAYDVHKKPDNYSLLTTGDGSIYSTTWDLYKFDQALRKQQLLNNENSKLMYELPVLKDGKLSEYGFGWYTTDNAAMHTGGIDGFRSLLWRDRSSNTCIIALTNQGDAFPVYKFLEEEKKALSLNR
ncbi:serine hydrolase domain-containing protein [Elizabethkingia anophelis]|uniref:serine hydrolase domain-containing protein n=1 Tax=Elizabethkingia anophelis TaxID=1117645 RepID=UPI000C6CC0D6|nr:serine hydrolase domain-containing protein [Elizabethkingia anophelis]PKR30559.1 serine hydrolase [Elizabethkingia anophelis]PKR36221.1 serine hydrolase [Elizabethkingia anophelis]PRQ80258.1 serine hydrolase [Elizabethkingia anophelis]PRQ85197.1 serine hydrolase [Elizabethkingia anophelis]PRQ87147.1 serine hydrolase [Elizabethkingia anophelis]